MKKHAPADRPDRTVIVCVSNFDYKIVWWKISWKVYINKQAEEDT